LFVFFRELETHHGNETCQKWEKIVNKLLLGAVTAAFARISERNPEEKNKGGSPCPEGKANGTQQQGVCAPLDCYSFKGS
jgi:hypothetical protein